MTLEPGMRYALGFRAREQADVDAALLLAHSSPYIQALCLYASGSSPMPEPPADQTHVLTFTFAGPPTQIPAGVDPFNVVGVRWLLPFPNSGEPPCGAPNKTVAITPSQSSAPGCPLVAGALVAFVALLVQVFT